MLAGGDTEADGRQGRTAPGRGWYGFIAALMVGTVVVTAVLGVGRATDLVTTVEDFQRFYGDGDVVSITEPGEYAVYHEFVGGGAGASSSTTREPILSVTGPDGAEVPLTPSSVAYGWGSRHGEGIGTFVADVPGEYRIGASDALGGLAFGPSIPGAPLYGTGDLLLGAGLALVACVVALVAVARRRRTSWGTARGSDRRVPPAAVVVGVVVVVAGGIAAVMMASASVEDTVTSADLPGAAQADQINRSGSPGTGPECVSDADFETGQCGLTPEELRDINLHYSDRLEFTGDLAAATEVAEAARIALEPLAPVLPAPSTEQVQAALAPMGGATVSSNAVRTAGTAFGIEVDGGCVFGSVHQGTVGVEVGGYVNDGGCMASYGH